MRFFIKLFFFIFPLFHSSQIKNDTVKIITIDEVIINKEKSSKTEKKMKIKWSFTAEDKFVSLVPNPKNNDLSLKQLLFKFKNESSTSIPLNLIIYDIKNNKPNEEIYSQKIILDPDVDILRIKFNKTNNFFRENGIFVGFEFSDESKNKVYVYTTSDKKSNSFIKKTKFQTWMYFADEPDYKELDKKYTNINLYYKIEYK